MIVWYVNSARGVSPILLILVSLQAIHDLVQIHAITQLLLLLVLLHELLLLYVPLEALLHHIV
mgnify:CR=1 FL=1